ncbi:MAG: multiheme c-type cytochrome [Planctomycetota bacterium]|nr:multiheme c-type cytochrome [Planctomycetota bacterium]
MPEQQQQAETTPAAPKVVKAIGPRLRRLLYVVFALLALLGANSGYLASVTALEWFTGETYQNYFYFLMFLGHLVFGLLIVVPFVVFGITHMRNTWRRRNRRAVRVGYALFAVCLAVLVTGLLLVRVSGVFDLKNPSARSVVYWLHVGTPIVGAWLYWLHRLVGPKIRWKVGLAYGGVVAATVVAMVGLHSTDPRSWNVKGPASGDKYFQPSLARTATGNFISADALSNDEYCRRCHADVHSDWQKSAHRKSSFNNPAYLTSVRETRDVLMARDGNVQASRWCAGCHDPVPFFSGAFDNPGFDDVQDPTAHAGITCTVCHAITNVNSNKGNGDYTIEEPLHYPFASSDSPVLQWVNEQLVKAKPAFHKKTFLKDFHSEAEFCSVCHKVSLPYELNHYKEFLRGQNHYDSYLLSGVSGHGIRSFYYPDVAQEDCNGCHMPPRESNDFGAKILDDSGTLKVHDHLFPGGNTAVPWWNGHADAVTRQQKILEGSCRVDIFGLRAGARIDGELTAPLRPIIPTLKPGTSMLLETVIRTLKLGHHLTQGTSDSNELWLQLSVSSGARIIGHSGTIDATGEVDPQAHRVNAFVLDKNGNRINRRNAQDIFTPLYNHQIPPGAGQTVHYELILPDDLDEPVTVELRLLYRKFDREYVENFIAGRRKSGDLPLRDFTPDQPYGNPLPVTVLASDRIVFPIEGLATGDVPAVADREIPEWQRWNDYGIGLLLKGKGELRLAADAFRQVEALGRYDGPLNLARALLAEGSIDEAILAVGRAASHEDPPAPPWTIAWLGGVLNRQQNRLAEAEDGLRAALEMRTQETARRGFDFSLDYVVRNQLASLLFDRARQTRIPKKPDPAIDTPETVARYEEQKQVQEQFLRSAVAELHRTLEVDSENATAHYLLQQVHDELGETELSENHGRLHDRYRPDDNAQGQAVRKARENYEAAGKAAEEVVIYSLSVPANATLERRTN